MFKSENLLTSCPGGARRAIAIIGFILFLPILEAAAGVLVAPTVIFISEDNRTGRINLRNPTDKPQEVNIAFGFGLPVSDSLGNVYVTMQDSAVTDPRSALGWIKAFPRNVIIAPGNSQVVRLVVRPPADLPDGEYWARIIIRSQNAEAPVSAGGDERTITTHLNLITQTAIMLKYRTGELVADLELQSASAKRRNSKVEVMIDMVNRGNVSYMGILECRLLDSDQKEISHSRTNLAVDRNLKRRVDLAFVGEGHRPPYRVDLRISSKGRTDVPPQDMIAGNKISYKMTVE